MTAAPDRAAARVFLGLGSNLGDQVEHLATALRRIGELGEVRAVSGVYETAPEGFIDQPPFLNMVAELETVLEPIELLEVTRGIERDRGRVRSYRNAPRTLDIDVLLFGGRVVESDGLTIPHPRMDTRVFVLVPLLEIAPEVTDPLTGRPYAEALVERTAGSTAESVSDAPGTGEMAGITYAGARRVMNGEELLDERIG